MSTHMKERERERERVGERERERQRERDRDREREKGRYCDFETLCKQFLFFKLSFSDCLVILMYFL